MWTYKNSTGELLDSSGVLKGKGYSGAPGAIDDASKDEIPDVGPIPPGNYEILEPRDTTEHGPYAMPLNPSSSTNTFGRSGFMIHGDSIQHPGAASHGCIIISRYTREEIWNSNDHELEVI